MQPTDLGWCPFCGGSFKPSSKIKEIYFCGRILKIHKSEHHEFMERGILKYLESPRSWPISQDAMDLSLVLVGLLGMILFFIWMFQVV